MKKKSKFILEFEKPLQALEDQLESLKSTSEEHGVDVSAQIEALETTIDSTRKSIYSNLTPWQRVQLARHPERPYSLDYIEAIFEDFQELHGDRCFKDDRAVVGGTAFFNGKPVMVIGQQKGRNTKENLLRNFGSPNPEGYRKALRLMRMAQKFQLPIISLIDTPGAYPGVGAEERHVAEAIAVNIREMSKMTVPIIAAVIGEGGSGGALGVAVADKVLVMENAYYSVISPEGCAAILWKDRKHSPEAADALQLNADKLVELKVADGIIKEPLGGAQTKPDAAAEALRQEIAKGLEEIESMDTEQMLEARYEKYRALGSYAEV